MIPVDGFRPWMAAGARIFLFSRFPGKNNAEKEIPA
jgi:hypothetical protein